ncbi:SURF1 family protein [Xylanimonas ulmi]|uniref:SURF1-like protein n=1 Tax=Xylanimonas ulmi TaxID=228973 RepID=A0A4Q7M989_9MICO|nr:SURF1 family protein [Xylanibacterium ulmi]RZS63212.1 cytochrome oxidase assembly protein ShyY1 [Xylanibacterium ulmi]
MPEPLTVRPSTWRALLRPRMLLLLVIALTAAALCARLGLWQWHRALERSAAAERHAVAEVAAAGPVGLGSLVAPQSPMPGDDVGRTVWARGTYEASGQRLVRGRALDGEVGYLVLTPLRVADDGTGGDSWADLSGQPVLAVVRGWVAAPSDAPGLAVPAGEVQVTGWLQSAEATSGQVAPDNPGGPPLTDAIAPSALVNDWGGPIWDGYLVLTASDPAQVAASDGGPAALPRPVIEGGSGLNLQSLFYAIEWAVFALFALAFYVRLARDELAVERGAPAPPGSGGPPVVRPPRGQDAGIAGLPG